MAQSVEHILGKDEVTSSILVSSSIFRKESAVFGGLFNFLNRELLHKMATADKQKANIHKGHRERTRKKYLRAGLDAFSEHEILEFLLFYCFAQQDTNELAHSLISAFGSVKGVLCASVDDLCQIKGMGEKSALLIKFIGDLIQRERSGIDERPILDTTDKIGKFVLPFFDGMSSEMVLAVALDQKLRVTRTIKILEGSLDTVTLPIAKVARTLVSSSAAAVIIAHNHPAGVAIPSVTDIRTTKSLKNALEGVGIQFVDHIIVAEGDYVSMRDSGGRIYSIAE